LTQKSSLETGGSRTRVRFSKRTLAANRGWGEMHARIVEQKETAKSGIEGRDLSADCEKRANSKIGVRGNGLLSGPLRDGPGESSSEGTWGGNCWTRVRGKTKAGGRMTFTKKTLLKLKSASNKKGTYLGVPRSRGALRKKIELDIIKKRRRMRGFKRTAYGFGRGGPGSSCWGRRGGGGF